jgi:hypothetical protein
MEGGVFGLDCHKAVIFQGVRECRTKSITTLKKEAKTKDTNTFLL